MNNEVGGGGGGGSEFTAKEGDPVNADDHRD